MPEYLMYFNQQWVGDHTEEWFRGRGPLAKAVVEDMKTAGVYVFAGGLEEDDGPIYADLHSLFLGIDPRGLRIPRSLDAWAAWLSCFDAAQMNEDEFDLLGATGDPWKLAAGALGPDLKLITVTLGGRGAAYVVASGFDPDPMKWAAKRRGMAVAERAQSGRVALQDGARTGDPTGCGDVWGATLFSRLLGGSDLEGAMREANRFAARNVEHRGATGLYRHLAGKLSHVGSSDQESP